MGSVQDFILFHLKNLLGGVAFVIIYIASSKSWSTRGDLTSLVSWIAARLLIARAWPIYLVDELVLGVLWKKSHLEFCQTSTTELLFESMWSAFR